MREAVEQSQPGLREPEGNDPDENDSEGFPSGLSTALQRVGARLAEVRLESWITLIVVGGAAAFIFWRLHPSKILSSSTPTGGDMGAHVWGPAFLRDELLPSFSLRGWTQDWYGGFPAMQFYMVMPYLLIVALDVLLPYGTAFKLVAVMGVVTMPISAWAMGRLSRWPFPLPLLASVGALLFVFDFNFTIYGGNIASTLAGEFAFSLGLSLALVYVGLLNHTLETGRHRAWASIVLALVALAHLIPLLFAVGVTVVTIAVRAIHRLPGLIGKGSAALSLISGGLVVIAIWQVSEAATPRLVVVAILLGGLLLAEAKRAWWAMTIGAGGALSSAFWTVPFWLRSEYLNDMGWEKLSEVRENLFFPDELSGDAARLNILWLLGLAALAGVVGLFQWNRVAMTWFGVAFATAVGFVHWPQHRLWNARLLPFWYLSLYLLAAIGVWWLVRAIVSVSVSEVPISDDSAPDEPVLDEPVSDSGLGPWEPPESRRVDCRALAGWAIAPLALIVASGFIAFYLGDAPGASQDGDSYRWGPLTVSNSDRNFVSGWANWNFEGYEGRTEYPEYFDLVTTMDNVGEEFGCGRALWEYDRDRIGAYGTPMAPMLLPHWTDGCIGSMEGLFFESSPTVPFHFLMQSELSANPSRPMRGLPYNDLDLDLGSAHMQMTGVRYYVAFTNEALEAASRVPERLEPIAFSSPWTVYLVHDSDLVEPLSFEPVVARDADNAGRAWTDPAAEWFNDPERWDVPVAASGPPQWARVETITAEMDSEAGEVVTEPDMPVRFEVGPRHAVDSATVSDLEVEREKISFSVDQVGVPILVKVSYFPNWSVDGAEGPYRVTPNWMVVLPTSNDVTLSYGATGVEYLGWFLSLLGLVAVVAMWRSRRVPDLDGPIVLPKRLTFLASGENAETLASGAQPEASVDDEAVSEFEPEQRSES